MLTGHEIGKERVIIECMCIVCHGPIPRTGRLRGVTGATCHDTCRRAWSRHQQGEPLPDRYDTLRSKQAYRREMEMVLAHVETLWSVLEPIAKERKRKIANVKRMERYYRDKGKVTDEQVSTRQEARHLR